MAAVDAVELLRAARTILLVDWPSREVPDTLARSGLTVVSVDGPGVYNVYEADAEAVRVRPVDGPPARADIVYAHRPIDELPEIIEQAVSLGARAIWLEHVSADEAGQARQAIESAGLVCVTDPRIAARVARS